MNNLNKVFLKIILSVLAGIGTTFYLITPILISTLWVAVFGINNVGSYLIYGIGLLTTLFRGIKIGWMKWIWVKKKYQTTKQSWN